MSYTCVVCEQHIPCEDTGEGITEGITCPDCTYVMNALASDLPLQVYGPGCVHHVASRFPFTAVIPHYYFKQCLRGLRRLEVLFA